MAIGDRIRRRRERRRNETQAERDARIEQRRRRRAMVRNALVGVLGLATAVTEHLLADEE